MGEMSEERLAEIEARANAAVEGEREACAAVADAVKTEREERLAALTAEGISAHDPARLALVVAIMDAETIAAKIRARGTGGPR